MKSALLFHLLAVSSWTDDATRVMGEAKTALIAAIGTGGVALIAIAAFVKRALAAILVAVVTAGVVLWAATHLSSISDKTGQQIDPNAYGRVTLVAPVQA